MKPSDVSATKPSSSWGGNLETMRTNEAGKIPISQGIRNNRMETNVRAELMAGWRLRHSGKYHALLYLVLLVTSLVPIAQSMSHEQQAPITEDSLKRIFGEKLEEGLNRVYQEKLDPFFGTVNTRLDSTDAKIKEIQTRLEDVERAKKF